MSNFHSLTINSLTRETDQAVVVGFHIPPSLKEDFRFKAGQYITLKTEVNGAEVRRAYSICTSPESDRLAVAIKEVTKGVFSVYANRELEEGMTLEVHPPEGTFILDTSAFAKATTYAAFAAGSGITPIMSMIKEVLSQSETAKFVLVYGNKRPAEAMFRDELLSLQKEYPGRLSIEWIYSQSREDGAHFGRIMKATVNFVIKNKYSAHDINTFYLCGPEAMINETTDVLKDAGISENQILFELFTSSDATESVEEPLEGQSTLTIIVDDEEHTFSMPQDKIILDEALDKDIDAPYSCQGGICSSCIARITEGTAIMRKNQILTDGEVAEGLVLTCQAHPTSSKVTVNYDEV